jgi:CTP:molybdopterin cytidylyltransferase MocA
MRVCGAVLAAGAGRRFGAAKQLAPLDGRPLVQWAVDAAEAAAGLDDLVVVVGARAGGQHRAADRHQAPKPRSSPRRASCLASSSSISPSV